MLGNAWPFAYFVRKHLLYEKILFYNIYFYVDVSAQSDFKCLNCFVNKGSQLWALKKNAKKKRK